MATTSCSKSTVMAGKIRTKYNKYTVILRHNNKSKNVLNYKCRSLSDCETSKTSIGKKFLGGWGLHRADGYGVSAWEGSMNGGAIRWISWYSTHSYYVCGGAWLK